MNLNKLKHYNNLLKHIDFIYVLDKLTHIENLLFIVHDNNLIISNNMIHSNLYEIIDNLTEIAKIINNEYHTKYNSSQILPNDLYDLLKVLPNDKIITIETFYNYYIDPKCLNNCKYNYVINYYLLFNQTMPSNVFNFFNNLIPEDIRIKEILNIPNIDIYLHTIKIINNENIIYDEILNKIKLMQI